jgi:hypothetical protein
VFFRAHDAVHVVYGCDASMPDEAVVKFASLFGTTGGWRVLHGYVHHETLDVYRHLPWRGTLVALVASPWLLARTLWRCARQTRRWPWTGHEPLMAVSLKEIRERFGIRVAHRASQAA